MYRMKTDKYHINHTQNVLYIETRVDKEGLWEREIEGRWLDR